jgi:hypothetical protein
MAIKVGTILSLQGLVIALFLWLRNKNKDRHNAYFLWPMATIQLLNRFFLANLHVSDTSTIYTRCAWQNRILTEYALPTLLSIQLLVGYYLHRHRSALHQKTLKLAGFEIKWIVTFAIYVLALFWHFHNECCRVRGPGQLLWTEETGFASSTLLLDFSRLKTIWLHCFGLPSTSNLLTENSQSGLSKAHLTLLGTWFYFYLLSWPRLDNHSFSKWLIQSAPFLGVIALFIVSGTGFGRLWDAMVVVWSLTFVCQNQWASVTSVDFSIVQETKLKRKQSIQKEHEQQQLRVF